MKVSAVVAFPLAFAARAKGFNAPAIHANGRAFPPPLSRPSTVWGYMHMQKTSTLRASALDDAPFAFPDRNVVESGLFTFTPLLAGVASFFMYPFTSRLFHNTVEFLSNNNWEPVDGGDLQYSILLPPLNGVVMTAISLLYANLVSTTGTQLRNRQADIHASLNSETNDVRGLLQLIQYYPENDQETFRNHIRAYVTLVTKELLPTNDLSTLRSANPPMSNYLDGLHRLSVEGPTVNDNILQQSYDAIQRIADARINRVTSLQTTFPPLHYVTISTLTAAMMVVFLIETDRNLILFLNNFQIRLIWSMLVGTFTAIFCIGYDLSHPFLGTYQVPEILSDDDIIVGMMDDMSLPRRPKREARRQS